MAGHGINNATVIEAAAPVRRTTSANETGVGIAEFEGTMLAILTVIPA